MGRIEINRATCRGYANCVLVAPQLFDLDATDIAVATVETVDAKDERDLQKAVYDCPTNSIAFVRDED
jgi:ferredoxin